MSSNRLCRSLVLRTPGQLTPVSISRLGEPLGVWDPPLLEPFPGAVTSCANATLSHPAQPRASIHWVRRPVPSQGAPFNFCGVLRGPVNKCKRFENP